MVPSSDGTQHKRTNVCLVGSVQNLLQLPGMMKISSLSARAVDTCFCLHSHMVTVCVKLINAHAVAVSLMHSLHFVRLLCLHSMQALADCVSDLLSPFHSDTIELVAGIDAMGFILGEKTTTANHFKKICVNGGLRACHSVSH